MCRHNALVVVFFALLAALAPAANAQQTPLEAGAAAADITGRVGTPMFAYTARSYIFSPDPAKTQERALQMVADPDTGLYAKTFEPSVGIHTRLLARAIVLRAGGQKYALAQADLGGLPYALVQEVAGRVKSTGIDAAHILLSATHTHSSVGAIWPADNNGYAFVGGDVFDPRVFDSTAQGIAEAILAADSRLRPARIGIGTAAADGASRNRSFEAFQHNVDVPKDPAAQRAASVDPTVTVLRVDRADGTPMAAWSNFAVHPTSFGDGNLLFSGDNAGIAARLAEQAVRREGGRKARGFVDVWTNSAQGDISPSGESASAGGQAVDYANSDAAGAFLAGARDADGIVRAWRAAGSNMSGDLPIGSRSFFFAFDGTSYGGLGGKNEPVSPYPVLGQGGIVQSDGTCAPVDDFAGPGQGRKMPLLGGPGLVPVSVPVSFWRIGKLGIAGYPVEITKQMGVRIRDGLLKGSGGALDRIVIAGLTNGYWSYSTTPEEYDACAYEGSFTLFGREEGYGWLAAGDQLMKALLDDKAAPAGFPAPPDVWFAASQTTPIRSTPEAGTVVKQPAAVARYGRAVFTWKGGDPQVDAPRGTPFVSLQLQGQNGRWRTVATDDTFEDTTQRGAGDVWTETFQFDRCREIGTYRFHVTGRAVTAPGAVASAYTVDSKPFAVSPVAIEPGSTTIENGVASVRPLYPDPGSGTLIALPRLVRGADVSFTLSDGRRVAAADPNNDGTYEATVGTASVASVHVVDGCANRG
jgi:neutral ceramidase